VKSWFALVLALAACATASCARYAPMHAIEPATFVAWHAQDGPREWTGQGITTGLAAVEMNDDTRPVWTISAPGIRPARVNFTDGTIMEGARIGIGPLSRGGPPSVIMQTNTGGTHCCWRVVVATPRGGEFHVVAIEEWDGDPIAWPRDLDGDGRVDFQNIDSSFQFVFGTYNCCMSPPVIFTIRGDKAVDVSREPGFAPVFRADMAHYARCPTEGWQPDCLAYAADAARLGEFDRAWPGLVAHFTRKDEYVDWNESQWVCFGKLTPYCRATYTDTLQAFLREKGYVR
jgi:hypothetical protein